MSPAWRRRRPLPRRPDHRTLGAAVAILACVGFLAGCASDQTAEVDPVAYRLAMNSTCAASHARQAALAEPLDAAGAERFAMDVAALLAADAEAFRAITPPDDIAADHRAFIRNVDDEARRWSTLAATPADDAAAFGAIQTEILELSLGRDDLAIEMQLADCARSTR